MATEFQRKSLPTASADPLSLIRHITEADPHPGRYIKIDGNTLDLEHPTLFKDYKEFQKMPTQDTVLGWSPRLVIFTGADQLDPITGVSYKQLHPYVYEGGVIIKDDQKYPVWIDKVDELTDSVFTDLKSLLYQHETDTGTLSSTIHPTLARKEHTHHYSDITNFSEGVFEVSKGIYAYAVGNETELESRRIDNALIIYTGESYEYEEEKYLVRGHLYRYDAVNNIWIDVSSSSEGYSKTDIDRFIEKHNANTTPFSHDSLALKDHKHELITYNVTIQNATPPGVYLHDTAHTIDYRPASDTAIDVGDYSVWLSNSTKPVVQFGCDTINRATGTGVSGYIQVYNESSNITATIRLLVNDIDNAAYLFMSDAITIINPHANTQLQSDNSTHVATTEYVRTAVTNMQTSVIDTVCGYPNYGAGSDLATSGTFTDNGFIFVQFYGDANTGTGTLRINDKAVYTAKADGDDRWHWGDTFTCPVRSGDTWKASVTGAVLLRYIRFYPKR